MKRNKYKSTKNYFYFKVIGIIFFIVLLSLLFFFRNNDNAEITDLPVDQEQDNQQIVEEIIETGDELFSDTLKEKIDDVTSKKVGSEGLCEDYFFEQGDILEIASHTVLVERIGKGALRLKVDNENYLLSEGNSEILGDDIEISLKPNAILYFGVDDSSNAAMIRVGCHYEDNPNEKYVEERGENLCEELYLNCQNSFGIDLE